MATGADPRFWKGGSKIEGEARIEGVKHPRIEGEAQSEGEAREKAGGGVWGGGLVSPSPENFWKFEMKTVQFGVYLEWHLIISIERPLQKYKHNRRVGIYQINSSFRRMKL